MTLLVLIIVALAAYRLTRLLTDDAILDGPRNWIFTHAPPKIGELLNCVHCTGVWVGVVCVALVLLFPFVGPRVLLFAAIPGAVSLLAARDGR